MKKKLLISAALVLLLGAGAVLLFTLQPQLRYIAADTVKSLFRGSVRLEKFEFPDDALRRTDLGALPEEENCAFGQSLLLVNAAHPLPEDFAAELTEYKDSGVLMNRSMTDAYAALSADVAALFGEKLYVRSSYRSAEEQAEVAASSDRDTAAEAGSSEHQTGLALDVYVRGFAGDGFLKSDAGQYVNGHCGEYGFIIRYPRGGERVTGIRFEPWHIRYVGAPHAAFIAEKGLTLEEYVEHLEPGEFYAIGGAVVSRQSGEVLTLPKEYRALTISPDNTGYRILTIWL